MDATGVACAIITTVTDEDLALHRRPLRNRARLRWLLMVLHLIITVSHEPTFSGNVTHAFSSRLSSLRKRQSVPSAMILFGLDVIMPASCRRSA